MKMTIQAPFWYDSSSVFDLSSFGTFMNRTIVSAESSISSSPTSSSSSVSGLSKSGSW